MPFFLPKGAEREYLTVNGIVAIYIAEIPDEAVMVGVSRDLYQTLIAVRRHHKYAAIVAAYWGREGEAEIVCDHAAAAGLEFQSLITAPMMANRIETTAQSLGIVLTDHHALLVKVRAAVAYVEDKLAEAQRSGDLRFFNRAFRQWRLQAKAHGRSMTYAEARARLRRQLYRQIALGEPTEIQFPALESLTA